MADPSLAEVAKQVSDTQTSLNLVWTLVTGFLVMFMQAGFALVETGLCRAKNAAHTMAHELHGLPDRHARVLGVGLRLQMGGVGAMGTFGNDATLRNEFVIHHRRQGVRPLRHEGLLPAIGSVHAAPSRRCSSSRWCSWTPPRPSRRARWRSAGSSPSFIIYSFVIGTIIYPLFGNWVWGGGWLVDARHQLRARPRPRRLRRLLGRAHDRRRRRARRAPRSSGRVIGKYDKDGTPNPIPGAQHPDGRARHVHPGLRLVRLQPRLHARRHRPAHRGHRRQHHARLGHRRVRVAYVYVSSSSSASPTLDDVQRHARRSRGDHRAVRIRRAPAAPRSSASSPASLVVVLGRSSSSKTLKIDDPVGAISVHGVNGAWGVLSLGLFADGTYGDGFNGVAGNVTRPLLRRLRSVLRAELIGIVTNFVWVSAVAFVALKVIGNSSATGSPRRTRSRASTFPRWALPATQPKQAGRSWRSLPRRAPAAPCRSRAPRSLASGPSDSKPLLARVVIILDGPRETPGSILRDRARRLQHHRHERRSLRASTSRRDGPRPLFRGGRDHQQRQARICDAFADARVVSEDCAAERLHCLMLGSEARCVWRSVASPTAGRLSPDWDGRLPGRILPPLFPPLWRNELDGQVTPGHEFSRCRRRRTSALVSHANAFARRRIGGGHRHDHAALRVLDGGPGVGNRRWAPGHLTLLLAGHVFAHGLLRPGDAAKREQRDGGDRLKSSHALEKRANSVPGHPGARRMMETRCVPRLILVDEATVSCFIAAARPTRL